MRELALHVLDLLQNAVEAGATRVALTIVEDQVGDCLTVTVQDDGRGMAPEVAARAANPFFTSRTTRHVGLGLPLLSAAAQRADGHLTIQSRPGEGTNAAATFRLSHPDRQPLGDLVSTVLAFLLNERAPQLRYAHRVVTGLHRPDGMGQEGTVAFEFDSAEIRAVLGDVPLTHPAIHEWLAGFLADGEQAIAAMNNGSSAPKA